MSYHYEFAAEVHDGAIALPREIAGQLHAHGITHLRVVLSTIAEEEDRLAQRGISDDLVERVAAVQRYDRDVAVVALLGEGSAAGSPFARRLAERLESIVAGEVHA